MKKCEFCAKEISYHEMYCSDECQDHANAFYDKRDKYQKIFSVLNGIFVLGIGVCIFLFPLFPDFSVLSIGVCLTGLGVMYMFLPFPPDIFIAKKKLKESIKIARIIGAVLLAAGIGVLIYGIIRIL